VSLSAGLSHTEVDANKIVHSVAVRSSLTRAVSAAVLVWSLVSAGFAWRDAARRTVDPVVVLEAEFRTLAPFLPPAGVVGFLRYDVDDDQADRIQVYYVAQYTLAPRLIEKRTDVEFLIVARDALRPGVDDRLAGFAIVTTSREGHRVYQRRVR
jgi:hypothetical protein